MATRPEAVIQYGSRIKIDTIPYGITLFFGEKPKLVDKTNSLEASTDPMDSGEGSACGSRSNEDHVNVTQYEIQNV